MKGGERILEKEKDGQMLIFLEITVVRYHCQAAITMYKIRQIESSKLQKIV